jgi:hypothetical protein
MDFNPESLIGNLEDDAQRHTSLLGSYRLEVLKSTLLKKYVASSSASIQLDRDARADFIRRNLDVQNFEVPESLLVNTLAHRLSIDLTSDWDGEVNSSYLSLYKVAARGGVGPGASVKAPDDDFLSKLFSDSISCTSEALFSFFKATLPANWESAYKRFPQKSVIVPGGNLSTVPKDCTKNRTICIEPTLNMYFQQGIRYQLEACLRQRYQIDITTQQVKNRDLARKGSVDGSLATIDLSNASDTISYKLVKRLIPPVCFQTLDLTRSPSFIDGGKEYRMGMISTMGNAFTFPLMTLLFSALCHTVAAFRGVRLSPDNFGVFGDDIIVPTVIAEDLLGALTHLGFCPNVNKSYTRGFFRESCGGDYFRGCDVRGIYVKRMENEADVYSAFNRLHRWSLAHGINLNSTLSYLKGLVKFRPVPRHESADAGFIVSSDILQSPKRDSNGCWYYRPCVTVPRRRNVCDRTYNPIGAKIAAIGGYVRNNSISLRPFKRKLIVVKKKTPCWDFSNDPVLLGRDLSDSWHQLLS